jgi:DNA-binding transcriptional regulator YdaS (Cro superfamily)
MTLRDHLSGSKETVVAFAERLGESPNTIRKIVYGQRTPSAKLAAKIVAATDGGVGIADLVVAPVERAA